jgi:hypothetical protein
VVVNAPDTITAGITSRTSTLLAVTCMVLLQGRMTATPATRPITTVLSFSGVVHVPVWA